MITTVLILSDVVLGDFWFYEEGTVLDQRLSDLLFGRCFFGDGAIFFAINMEDVVLLIPYQQASFIIWSISLKCGFPTTFDMIELFESGLVDIVEVSLIKDGVGLEGNEIT